MEDANTEKITESLLILGHASEKPLSAQEKDMEQQGT